MPKLVAVLTIFNGLLCLQFLPITGQKETDETISTEEDNDTWWAVQIQVIMNGRVLFQKYKMYK